MTPTAKRKRMREVLEGARCVYPASVFDPISARIAEDLGYETGMFAGSIASMTVLGAPDLIVLHQGELAEQCRRIGRAGDLPLIVDADHGYGNALNVRRTVEELETAGIAALTIEDTELPAAFARAGEPRLIPVAEGVGKMKAALDARQDPELVVAGRTSAASVTDVADAVERIKAYQDAGVDMLMLVGIKTREALEAIADAARVPLMIGGAAADLVDIDYLSPLGVRVCLTGHQPFMAGINAVHDMLKALRESASPARIANPASAELLKSVMRQDDYQRWLDEYLNE